MMWGGPRGPQPMPSSACRYCTSLISLAKERVQGDPRTRGSAPLPMIKIPALGKLSDIGIASCHNPFESTVTTLALLPPA